jgi:hypothetical protein
MKLEGNFVARLKILVGQRGVSKMLASLDLGVTGVGDERIMEMTYKPGEKVDGKRVRETVDRTIAEMEKKHTPLEIVSYEIIEIVFVPDKEEA